MARIRTVKPEFFTSADIVALTPLARLFYVSLWCEADREGRLSWNLRTLKLRYFPGDDCSIDALAGELIDAGRVVLYEVDSRQYAEIPSFKKHQIINNREAASDLPERKAEISPEKVDASVTRESGVSGEGKEGRKGREIARVDSRADSSLPPAAPEAPPPAAAPPLEDPIPAVVQIPLNDGSQFSVTNPMVDEWLQAYPAVNVEQKLREMRAWALANPTKRKTRRGVQAFINRWLAKEQDSGRGARSPSTADVGSFV